MNEGHTDTTATTSFTAPYGDELQEDESHFPSPMKESCGSQRNLQTIHDQVS